MKWRFSQPIEIMAIFQFTHIWHSRKIVKFRLNYTYFARVILTVSHRGTTPLRPFSDLLAILI